MNDAKLIFVSPYFQFCLRAEDVMAALLFRHRKNQRNIRMDSVRV